MNQHPAFVGRSVIRRVRLYVSGLALVLLTACGGGNTVDEEGWRPLFNNSDLTGWNIVGDANWRVEERAARADRSTGASFLVSDDRFADFDLELEFWVDPEANSGVFLRCQDAGTITDTSCYEVNIFDTRPDQTYRTGAIVNVAEPAEFVYTGGQWNRLKIAARGSQLQVTLNERLMVDTKDSRFSSGPIALQYGAGEVRFRNVRIRERTISEQSAADLFDGIPRRTIEHLRVHVHGRVDVGAYSAGPHGIFRPGAGSGDSVAQRQPRLHVAARTDAAQRRLAREHRLRAGGRNSQRDRRGRNATFEAVAGVSHVVGGVEVADVHALVTRVE